MTPAFFEGPEKKVEVAVVDGFASLRSFGHSFWDQIVQAAQAQILSTKSNEFFDAYLLSESSLFVYDSFVTMITCGRTRLVDAVVAMLERIPKEAVAACIYERKREHFPQHQPTTFHDDAATLAQLFDGQALRFGAEHEHAVYMFHAAPDFRPDPEDVTLEVLMHGIPEHRAREFRPDASAPSADLASSLGLDRLCSAAQRDAASNWVVDEYLFTPAGYSLNGMLGPSYVSLHVTPEEIGSYASFETNLDFRADPAALVQQVITRFEPESFDLVCFVPDDAPLSVAVPGYHLRRVIQEPLAGYHVTFQHFFQASEKPGRAYPLPLL